MILAYNINKCCITMGAHQYYHGNTTVSLKSTVFDSVIHLQCEFANSWDLNPHSSTDPLVGSSFQHHNNASTRMPTSSVPLMTWNGPTTLNTINIKTSFIYTITPC